MHLALSVCALIISIMLSVNGAQFSDTTFLLALVPLTSIYASL